MIFFARAVITAKENQETTLYIILDEPESEYDLPVLTKEQIVEHSGYKAFVSKYRPKSTVTIDYTVYKVDRDIDAAITNCVSLAGFPVIGKGEKSSFDDSVRQAPAYAFYQQNILSVINRNSVNPANPAEIFTGSFMFGEQGEFGDQTGNLPYPTVIKDLFEKTIVEKGN